MMEISGGGGVTYLSTVMMELDLKIQAKENDPSTYDDQWRLHEQGRAAGSVRRTLSFTEAVECRIFVLCTGREDTRSLLKVSHYWILILEYCFRIVW